MVVKPSWLKINITNAKEYSDIKKIVSEHKLHTICESGKCPNIADCWAKRTATFLILGNICTRNCSFCAVNKGKTEPIDFKEPENIANSVNKMQLTHAVITSVNRDDLEDGGAEIWKQTIFKIKEKNPATTIETLIPDFEGKIDSLDKIIEAKPNIVSHNLETVENLTKLIRKKAEYKRSLFVLKYLKQAGIITKSGIMLGLGENKDEVIATMHDLKSVNCDILTLGQYLQPTKNNYPVQKYYSPDEFAEYKEIAMNIGFRIVESAPLIRSSYNSAEQLKLVLSYEL